mmetsp:Transcript_8418/g.24276  ORF Transcript_8418/g.24276 Transcript_8418/m.24276 type:complete len:300 (-) Transcript_8418:238-1137(-)
MSVASLIIVLLTALSIASTTLASPESSTGINLDGIRPCPQAPSHTGTDPVLPAKYVADTRLPTDVGQFRLRAYRIVDGIDNDNLGTEPCVIYCADKVPFGSDGKLKEGVPVRVHDQCMTSEVFRSQRCDCKEQLKLAMEYIREYGGAIIYLQQEGRGIGLANKVAAYAMQDAGCDTVDANRRLGFPDDARQYGAVPSILADMNIGSIKLMSNNPRKMERLRALGVNIVDTVPVVIPQANPHNMQYLETKHARMNHQNLDSLLDSSTTNNESKSKSNHAMLPRRHVSRGGASASSGGVSL